MFLSRFTKLCIAAGLLIPACLFSQTLLVDRPFSGTSTERSAQAGWTKDDKDYLGDDFTVGHEGETWVLDKIRTWVIADSQQPDLLTGLSGLFEKVTLNGALANDEATVQCACHNLIPMKTALLLNRGSSNEDVAISRSKVGPGLWQIDFDNLRWSVPGAVKVEFGIKAVGRLDPQHNTTFKWLNAVSPVPGDHALRVFSNDGALQSFLDKTAQNSATSRAMNIQVWGHLLAKVAIRPVANGYEIALLGAKKFDVKSVDPATLRFGPLSESASAPPRFEDTDGDGIIDAVFTFAPLPKDVADASVNACLTGQRTDGVPFEGCDLLKHK